MKDGLKEIASQLKILEERRKLALSLNGVGIWDWNVETGKLYWDDGMFAIYNCPKHEFKGGFEDWSSRVHPNDIDKTKEQILKCVNGEERYIFRFRVKRGDKWGVVSGFGNVIKNELGKSVRVVGINVLEGELCDEHNERFLKKDPCETCPSRRALLF